MAILHPAVYMGWPEKSFLVIDCRSPCLDFDAYAHIIARREPRRLPACLLITNAECKFIWVVGITFTHHEPRRRCDNGENTLVGAFICKMEGRNDVRNLAGFRTTLDFDREYLSKESRYRQPENGVINQYSSYELHNCNTNRLRLRSPRARKMWLRAEFQTYSGLSPIF